MISTKRLAVLASIIVLLVAVVLGRTVQLQLAPSAPAEAFMDKARQQQDVTVLRASPRGTIYDTNGDLMAVSVRSYSIRIDPAMITNTAKAQKISAAIALAVSKPLEEVQAKVDGILSDSKRITRTIPNVIYTNVSAQAINQMTTTLKADPNNVVDGVYFDRSWTRYYPMGNIAGPVVGYAGRELQGLSGIEQYYDTQLSPQEGVREERYPTVLYSITPTLPGQEIVSTIVGPLQVYSEARLRQAIKESGAVSGEIIVLDTHTAAILAMASYPNYDPNDALDLLAQQRSGSMRNSAVSDLYEPGSVMKLITLASAIDEGTMDENTQWKDTGHYTVDGHTIRNSDLGAHGVVTSLGVLQWSLNVVAAQVSKAMGQTAFYRHLALFGVGNPSGVDLAGENAAKMRNPSSVDWRSLDLAEQSFGQSLQVTPLQLANSINAIANDGILMQPYAVKQRRAADGTLIVTRPTQVGRAISAETSRKMREVTAMATRTATPKALFTGYTAAGKTGTAQWFKDGVMQKTTIVSYVGWVPSQTPRITILIKLNQPKTETLSAPLTVPVFHDIGERACQILGIPPDVVKEADQP
jgi:cell division protein FtsI (penicillin-binding protein 3)